MSTTDDTGRAQPSEAADQPDPREQMKAALEAKKNAQHGSAGGPAGSPGRASGGPHGQQGGKRQFRRRSGG
ncbi:DUF5302 domain-containing protein [Propioniciclava soli]|uniref:DUF5302 domain-containing protein n=1 Tax=Propioniciclava soli TaxID=2775081 RepID=A0ABZ3C7M7_9ACTN